MTGKRITQDEFVERSNEAHDYKYDYSKAIYTGSKSKVIIRCIKHDTVFSQLAGAHLQGKSGCVKCKGDSISCTKHKDTVHFIQRAIKRHGDFFDYSESNYVSSDAKIKIRCKLHDVVFEQTATNHYFFNGCPECLRESRRNHPNKMTYEDFVNRSQQYHGNFYDYSLVELKNVDTYVKIVCPVHGIFEQSPYQHATGTRCPDCAPGSFKVNAPASLYVFSIKGRATEFTGFGITAHIETRISTHKRNIGSFGCFIEESFVSEPLQGVFIRELENTLLKTFPRASNTEDLVGFKRENTTAQFTEVVDFCKEQIMKYKGEFNGSP